MSAQKSMYQFLVDKKHDKDWNAVNFLGKSITYGNLIEKIDACAFFLKNYKIEKGENVAICLPNLPHAVIAFYAANKCGIVANVIHPLVSEFGLLSIIKKSNPRMIFLSDLFYHKFKYVLDEKGIPAVICDMADFTSFIVGIGAHVKLRKDRKRIDFNDNVIPFRELVKKTGEVSCTVKGRDTAAFLHSGGTTGDPKTIVLSNFAINSLAKNTLDTFSFIFTKDDASMMVLPLFHGFGLGVNMHSFLSNGCRIVMVPKFEPKEAVKLIKNQRITVMAGVPTMYDKLLQQSAFSKLDMTAFRLLFCGGDTLSDELRDRFDNVIAAQGSKVKLLEGYGLTETVAVLTVNRMDKYKAGSIGTAIIGARVKVVDANMDEVSPNICGEVLATGEALMDGYYRDSAGTAKATYLDADGVKWLRTGDYCYMDEEGFLFFKDRIKRTFVISGVNVYPSEIENVVSKMKEIVHCCAVQDQTSSGKIVIKLFIVLRPGIKYSLALEGKIFALCKEKLIKFAVPGKIIPKDSLPLTQIGKVDYKKVEILDRESDFEI